MKYKYIDNILFLLMLFFMFSFFGWLWEGFFELLENGNLINSGVLFGPWLPIYGSASVVIYLLLKNFKENRLVSFMGTFIICTFIEYFTSIYLEYRFNLKWWDYNNKPFNINGRVCLLYSLFFAFCGYMYMHKLIPKLKIYYEKMNKKKLTIFISILLIFFITDQIHSHYKPHVVKKLSVEHIIKINIPKKNH